MASYQDIAAIRHDAIGDTRPAIGAVLYGNRRCLNKIMPPWFNRRPRQNELDFGLSNRPTVTIKIQRYHRSSHAGSMTSYHF